LSTKLTLLTRLYKDARSTKHKTPSTPKSTQLALSFNFLYQSPVCTLPSFTRDTIFTHLISLACTVLTFVSSPYYWILSHFRILLAGCMLSLCRALC